MPVPTGSPSSGTVSLGTAGRFAHGDQEALTPGMRLAEFEILRVLGSGGFGVVYLALDTQLQRQVALKEYLPALMAGRGVDGRVSVRSRVYAEVFAKGLESFVNEARLLARFDNASLVKVHRFWEANGTAYMVMPYYDGATLKAVRQSMNTPPDETWLRRVLDSLLGALEVLHTASVYHRDVAPDNILLLRSGQPVLLDFGAARHVMGQTQTLTAMLKPAYAPIEQYAEANEFRQGPWTDIYSTAATLHYCLTGRAPPTAAARAVHDSYRPLRLREELEFPLVGRPCDPQWLAALDWGLEVKPQARPQSIAQWRAVLSGHEPIPRTLSLPEPDPEEHLHIGIDGPLAGAPVAPVPVAAPAPRPAAAPSERPAAARRASPSGGMSFRQVLPWALWVLAAVALAVAAVYFRTHQPPSPFGDGGAPALGPAAEVLPRAAPASGIAGAAPGALPSGTTARSQVGTAAGTPAETAVPGAAGANDVPVAQAGEAAPPAAAASPASTLSAAMATVGTARAPRASAPHPAGTPPPQRHAIAPPEPSSPSEVCGKRVLFALWNCMRTTCSSNRWVRHPQCVEWVRTEQRDAPQN